MSLAEKLRAYLSDKAPTWTDDAATWNDGSADQLLIVIDGAPTTDALIDAHVRALAQGAQLTIAHTGAPTPVALRTCALFGITLLDTTALPEPPAPPIERAWADATDAFAAFDALATAHPRASAPVPPRVTAPGSAFPTPPAGFFRALERPIPDLPDASDAFAALDALVPMHPRASAPVPPRASAPVSPLFPAPPAGFFRALERLVAEPAWALGGDAAFDPGLLPEAPPEVPTPEILGVRGIPTTGVVAPEADPTLVVASSQPDPIVAHADSALPWDLSLSSAPEREPVRVEATELAAMPWNLHSEQHEMLPAGRAARFMPARPSALAQDWGLPWPRPVVPTSGLSIQDPRVWHAQERIEAVREDLNKVGAPSFGAAKPEGSSWLKRLSEFP